MKIRVNQMEKKMKKSETKSYQKGTVAVFAPVKYFSMLFKLSNSKQ